MSFLSPYFLFALAVLAIPILVHLFHFRRYKTIRFSSLRFLRNIETERKNRNRLKHLLVLSARCLAFACLVLAFALPGCGDEPRISGKRSVRIYVDNSFSMDKRNADGILFETARQKARDIIKSLENEAEFQIISNNISNIHPRYVSASEAISAVDKLTISPRSESFSKIWKWMENHQPEGGNKSTVFYCISDFQSAFLSNIQQVKNTGNTKTFGMKIPYDAIQNLSLDTAWLVNPFALAGERNRLSFRVTNYSDENADGVNIKLRTGNITAGLAKVQVDKHSSATGSVEFTMPAADQAQAVLEMEDASNPFDNVLYLAMHARGNVKIALDGNNKYLFSALKANNFFEISNSSVGLLKFPTQQVCYKLVSGAMSDGEVAAIQNFVGSGGRVVLVPALNMPDKAMKPAVGSLGFPEFTSKNTAKIKMRKDGLANPFFNQVFQSVPANMEMPVVSNYYTTSGSNGNGESILSLENGDPFLLYFKSGKGGVYLFTAPFAPEAGNFVQSVLFFPVVANCAINNQIAGNLFGQVASGQGYLLHRSFNAEDGNFVLTRDKVEFVPEIQNGVYGKELFISPFQNSAGFYELRTKGNGEKESIALNDTRTESDPAAASSEQLAQLEKNAGLTWLDPDKAGLASAHKSADSGMWRLFIWLAAAFFALEVLLLVFWDGLARRFTSPTQIPTPTP